MTIRQNWPPSSAEIYLSDLSGGMRHEVERLDRRYITRIINLLGQELKYLPHLGVYYFRLCAKISVVISQLSQIAVVVVVFFPIPSVRWGNGNGTGLLLGKKTQEKQPAMQMFDTLKRLIIYIYEYYFQGCKAASNANSMAHWITLKHIAILLENIHIKTNEKNSSIIFEDM